MAARPPSGAASGLGLVARVLAWLALALLALVVLAAAGVVWLNTTPGRAFVARRLSAYTMESGLRFEVGRIDGSLFGHLTVHDLRAVDLRGTYATVPLMDVRWRPGEVAQNRLSIAALIVPELQVLRLPVFRPTTGPLLPSFDIRVDRFTSGRIALAPALTGRAEQLRAEGRTDIRQGRALVDLDAAALSAPDRLHLHLDAQPGANRFELAATVDAPRGGIGDKLTGLGRALRVTAGGRGTYADWRGSALAAVDGKPVANLALTAARGVYRLSGDVTANALAPAATARLLAPGVKLVATARVVAGGAMVNASALSNALRVDAAGRAGTDAAGFQAFTVTLALPRPELAYDGLNGRNVRARLVLDGPLRTPAISYAVTADTLAFKTTGVTAFQLTGDTHVPVTGPLPVPFTLSAATVTGVPQAAGDLIRGLRAMGTLMATPKQVTADRVAFRSDRLTGTVTAAYTFASGQYVAALNGAISRYALPGIGIADVTVQSRIAPSARGELTLRAELAATAVRIDSAGAQSFLGGLPRVRASIAREPAGLIVLSNVALTAPKLTIVGGHGVYDPKGTIRFDAAGQSAAYGAVAISVTGAVARPAATIRLANPGVGVGLTNVIAVASPAGQGYAVAATGTTPQGAVTARVRIALGGGPLTIDIDQLTVAGLTARGRLAATAAGPYAGRLTVDGAGLTGAVTLAAAGAVQGASGDLTLVGARLPLTPVVTVGHGRVRFSALLTPGAPTITGRADLAEVRRDTLRLTSAVVVVDDRAGQGRAGLRLAGNAGQDFTANAGVAFAPGRYRVALDGTLDKVAFRLAAPAEVSAVAGGYRLAPATLLFPKGRLDVSGERGSAGTVLDVHLSALDLSTAALLQPELRLGGTATGHVQLRLPAGDGLPDGRADLSVTGLTRASIVGASVPVDLAATATLGATGTVADAVMRRQGMVIGRLQARVAPGPGTGTGRDRIMAGALSGGVRFTGPAEALWALSGLSGSDVRGAVAVGADFGGSPGAPTVNGVARAAALRYENLTYGTILDNIVLDSRFTGSRFELMSLTARAGSGSLSASGTAAIDPVRGFPFAFQATLKSAVLANSQALSATVSGSARAVSTGKDAKVTGDFTVEKARYRIQRADTAPVAVLAVRHKGAPPPPVSRVSAPSRIALDVKVKADNQILVEGLGLTSEWRASVRARGTVTTPELTGTADIVRGTYTFSGKSFDITRGHVALDGSYPPSPTVDIVATATLPDITATITIGGTATRPDITFASIPALPQDEILSRLLFGVSVTQLSATEALQLASALNGLRGGGTGLDPIGRLGKIAGLDRLRIIGADKTTGRGTALAFGKYIGRKIYIEVTTDAQGNAATSLQYSLNRVFSVLAQVGAIGQNSVNFRYSRDY